MRRRRKSREVLGVSLFPFLAVLICTLGVLIVLLVLAVKAADVKASDAREKVDVEVQEAVQALTAQNDFKIVQIEGLKKSRPEVSSRLADARSQRGYLEEEVRQLKHKALELGEQLVELEQEQPVSIDVSTASEAIAKLESEISTAQASLEQQRNETKAAGPAKYSIVPHAGSGGTFRRPIFVECTGSALILQPLGIELPKSEFVPPLQPGNMLDSALLAIREYWERYDLVGQDGSPYPLLVVRPDGAETYALARHAMQSWDDEFGYELVESDKILDFGQRDVQLAATVKEAIADARRRQQFVENQRRSAQFRSGTGFGSSLDGNPATSGRHGYQDGDSNQTEMVGLTASSPMGGFVTHSDSNKSAGALAREINGEFASGPQSPGTDRAAEAYPLGQNQSDRQSDAAGSPDPSNRGSSQGDDTGKRSSSASQSATSAQQAGTQNAFGTSSLAGERGSNWALPSQTPGATGYVRPIRVVCGTQTLEVRSSIGLEKSISINSDIASAVDPLVNEIWKQIEAWGISGGRSYWIPELRISVTPGGELNFERLRVLLADSGIVVKESEQ